MKKITYVITLSVLCIILAVGQKKPLQRQAQKPVASQQQKQPVLLISEKQCELAYSPQVFLEAKTTTGAKERFGLIFKNTLEKNLFAEIIDAGGKVVESITLNEYLSGSTKVKLLSTKVSPDGRTSEVVHEIASSIGTLKLLTKGLRAGDKTSANGAETIILTFSLSVPSEQMLGLRLLLPVEGTAEVKEKGVILSGKTSTSVIAVSVLPAAEKIEYQKNILSIKSSSIQIKESTPVVWLVASVVTNVSVTAAKAAAVGRLVSTATAAQEPNLVIVNTVSKNDAQPGDTVTYQLTCKNIGLGDATNIQLTNPIPVGTVYIEGSATTDGADVVVERESVPPPQASSVKNIKWTLKEALKSGQEFTVEFKVAIR